MPRNTRQWARRKIQQVEGLLDNCNEHLCEIADIYHDPQPLIANNLIDTAIALKQLAEGLQHLRNSI